MPADKKYFGEGLPYRPLNKAKGKLIAIEGTDGVGRSTQIELLKDWIELKGHAVLETGWSRSNLMSQAIQSAKMGNTVDRLTFSLLYATDFADRLENQILPALEAGFIVLADRYIYTAFARDWMREGDRKWIVDVFGYAVVPDLVCYLGIDIDTLIPRVIESGGMNYWESGADLHLGEDLYDNFRKYQTRMIREFEAMADEYHFEKIDARKSVDEIQQQLREKVEPHLVKVSKTPKAPPSPAPENKGD